jgi:Holliday junction resolvase RusA-like endonuclease
MSDIAARGPRSAGRRNAANAAIPSNRQEVQIIGARPAGDQSTAVFPSNRTLFRSPFYFAADTADACYFNAEIGELGFVVMRGNPKAQGRTNTNRSSGQRYNKSIPFQKQFASVVQNLLVLRLGRVPSRFQNAERIRIDPTFVFRNTHNPNSSLTTVGDIDNLVKFVYDGLDNLALFRDDNAVSAGSFNKERFAHDAAVYDDYV